MKVSFQTKAESKKMQKEEFLKLSPSERVMAFFMLSKKMKSFPTKAKHDTGTNFVLELKTNND